MKYQPGQSTMHRLHPAVKLAWLLWCTVAVFVFSAPTLPVIAAGCAVALLWWSGVAPWRIPGIQAWLTLGIGILFIQVAFIRQGDPVVGPVTSAGLAAGLRAAGRLLAVILMSALFVITTEPFSLACALMGIGLPYRWGFALVTALRLAPVFQVEAHHVYRAQLVRGVAYDTTGPRRWWLLLRHLCLPLLVSALRTAHALSLSMEGRAFGLHRRRTYLRQVAAGRRDVVAGGLLVLSIGLAVWYVWTRAT
ncbi:MAG: energy-coupling factor transporter transmembrane protein EcfT [Phycisphaerales bacterium]|nr:MAG: energy-coupling factor transporter transmembrane protein EcfT [Phycisphaerales bacterium]